MCGFGAVAAALGGAFVGYLYGRDQALTAASAPWYSVGGFVIGAVAGIFLGLVPAGVFHVLAPRTWASGPVRIAVVALAGAAPLTIYGLVVSGFASEVAAFCVMVTGTPAALAAAILVHRNRRSVLS